MSCSNGTVALEVALRAIGIRCGDEVIVPPFTFVATATAVLLCHGCPVFVDIDPNSFCLSPAAVEAAITSRTRASAGHLWLFGGNGYDVNAQQGFLDDLWEFDPSTNEWTWMGGNSTTQSRTQGRGWPGVYGTLGAPGRGQRSPCMTPRRGKPGRPRQASIWRFPLVKFIHLQDLIGPNIC